MPAQNHRSVRSVPWIGHVCAVRIGFSGRTESGRFQFFRCSDPVEGQGGAEQGRFRAVLAKVLHGYSIDLTANPVAASMNGVRFGSARMPSLVRGSPLHVVTHTELITGKNSALPAGTSTVRVTVPSTTLPARNQTGPFWPIAANSPVVSVTGFMSGWDRKAISTTTRPIRRRCARMVSSWAGRSSGWGSLGQGAGAVVKSRAITTADAVLRRWICREIWLRRVSCFAPIKVQRRSLLLGDTSTRQHRPKGVRKRRGERNAKE